MMMALSSEPDATSVALNPRASDSIAMKTPTVPAMPRTATIADVQRAFTLRTLEITGIAISDPPQCVDYTHPHRTNAGSQSAYKADEQRRTEPDTENRRRQNQLWQ